jgi:hypothetical protein
MSFSLDPDAFRGPGGRLAIATHDEVSRKLAMLIEGECGTRGPSAAAQKFGLSRQRYFQLRASFLDKGAAGLVSHARGPKTNYRRTDEAVCQIIRHRFLDPEASAEVIAQKLRQAGLSISVRSVNRVFTQFGLQKKTLPVSPGS